MFKDYGYSLLRIRCRGKKHSATILCLFNETLLPPKVSFLNTRANCPTFLKKILTFYWCISWKIKSLYVTPLIRQLKQTWRFSKGVKKLNRISPNKTILEMTVQCSRNRNNSQNLGWIPTGFSQRGSYTHTHTDTLFPSLKDQGFGRN